MSGRACGGGVSGRSGSCGHLVRVQFASVFRASVAHLSLVGSLHDSTQISSLAVRNPS